MNIGICKIKNGPRLPIKTVAIQFVLFIGLIIVLTGCKKNISKDVGQMTITELQTAANDGNSRAMVVLGALYETGEGKNKITTKPYDGIKKRRLKETLLDNFVLAFVT